MSYQEPERSRGIGLQMPKNLPEGAAPEITLPTYDPLHPEERLAAIDRIFPAPQLLPADIVTAPVLSNRPMTAGELENLSLSTNPIIRQAESDIVSARGNAIQLGTHPNPLVGYEGDTIGSAGTADYHGAYFQQFIKTAGKLQLQQAAAMIDVRNAELRYAKARIALITQVQARYYAVLVAEEAMRTNQCWPGLPTRLIASRSNNCAREAAAYEPMQLRVLAIQARATLVQARNRYYSAWKQLAAVVNRPDMPPTQLAGNLSIPIPMLRYEPLKNMVWDMHPGHPAVCNGEKKPASCCGSRKSRRS